MTRKTASDTLNDKQSRFCHEYVKDFNGKQAAIRAGYSAHSAEVMASQLLSKSKVSNKVNELRDRLTGRTEMTAQEVVNEAVKIARADLRKLFGTAGELLPPEQWPEDVAGAISSIEVVESKAKYGTPEYTKKIRIWDKNAALEKLFKYFGLYEQDNRQRALREITITKDMDPADATRAYKGLLAGIEKPTTH